MRTSATVLLLLLLSAANAAAQDEAALKRFFEGKRVTVKMDMPATSQGVDVYPQRDPRIDPKKYVERMNFAGTALREGDIVLVTFVKLKKDLIEFHLDGGGYDGGSGDVTPEYIGKSRLEQQLEKDVKAETDPKKKRELERQLADERSRRAREERRARELADREERDNKERIARERLSKGSRFNLRFQDRVPADMNPDRVMAALSQYVDFTASPVPARTEVEPEPPATRGSGGMPRKGMLRADVEREFGKPEETTERREGALRVSTLVFLKGDQKITAEFVEDVLIRYTISSR